MFTRPYNFSYGSYRIANIDETAANASVELQIQIQKHERDALTLILGHGLYIELMQQLETDGSGHYVVKESADEKWKRLVNGCDYTSACGSRRWNGITYEAAKVADKSVYESILAPYIFFHWSLNNRTVITGTGEAKGSAAGTIASSGAPRRIDAWNDFVQAVSFGYPDRSRVSLHQFLIDHCEAFPNAIIRQFETMTYYDI